MPDISTYPRIARFVNGPDESQGKDLHIKSEHGSFATHAEAEAAARKVADSAGQDAVIIQDDAGFHVYGVDELHSLLPGGSFTGEVIREAPIVSFVATDPLSGVENVIGKQSATTNAAPAQAAPTVLDTYAQKYAKDLGKVLGKDKESTLAALNERIRALEAEGIKVSIELDDDVFENRDKLAGFRHLLDYALAGSQALKERSIREIAIVDEWDNAFGTKVELEYDKKSGARRLEIGDDFLDDWGEGLAQDKDSLKKLSKELGGTLKPNEIEKRSEIFQGIRGSLVKSFDQINSLQQATIQAATPAGSTGATGATAPGPERAAVLAAVDQTITRLEKEVIPQAEKTFAGFSIKQERQLSQKYLDTFKGTLKAVRSQLEILRDSRQISELEFNARLEKLKLILVKGVKDVPVADRNYFGSYVGGLGSNSKPSAGLEYSHAFGKDYDTLGSLRAGTTSPVKAGGVNTSDIMLGLGVSHTFHSRNKLLDGANVGLGIGFSRETPFMIGASASQSWYLNDYHGLKDEWSAVGGVHATVGSYSNIGASLDVSKQFGDRVQFEGYGELSLWNQAAELEGEFAAFGKDKNVYLTAGVGTNKLVYAGIGFADKYEVELGLGGVSVGKDANNLPGESGWEIGLRTIPLPLPYFRHHRVPGYQLAYGDKSTEYITPNGSFMTIKKDEKGNSTRQVYVPDPKAATAPNQIVYRQISSKAQLDQLDQAPKREITIGPLGYLTVTDNGETIIADGLIQKELSEADMGIITDQAGVLWFDRMNPESPHHALGTRRQEMPLPLYRAVHY